MRKYFDKVIAGVVTTSLVATLAIGMNIGSKTVKAEVANAITSNWTNLAESYEPNDALITESKFTSTAESITADITISGWQAEWVAEKEAPQDAIVLGDAPGQIWGEKPYQITSTNTAYIVPGNTYKLKFTVNNGMKVADTETPSEKNITITVNSGIEGDNDNTMLFKTVTIPAGATQTVELDVPISADYQRDTVQVQLAYGSYSYSYNLTQAVKEGKVTEADAKACTYAYAYGTTENVNTHGTLSFTDISLMGEKYVTSVIPPKGDNGGNNNNGGGTNTTQTPTNTVQTPTNTTPTPTVVKKLGKVTKVKAKNNKKGTAKISWKKVANAKSYVIKVGSKKYTSKKVSVTAKKLKKGKTYKVQVRAKASGYKTGAWSKAVKVKIKK